MAENERRRRARMEERRQRQNQKDARRNFKPRNAEKVEVKETKTPEKVDVNAFIARKLKVINEIESDAQRQFLAQRVLNNKRGK